jgi:alpha-tubulin suppressor-like RCC1 family protein
VSTVAPPLAPAKITLAPRGAIALGTAHSCEARPDGAVHCWGTGPLGKATDSDRAAPFAVDGLDSVVELAATDHHTCARRRDGSVTCWGENTFGQLGYATPGFAPVPKPSTPVSGLTHATSIGLGRYYSCASRADGKVACWGNNLYGQLGDPSRTERSNPDPGVVPGLSNVVQISASSDGSCALDAAGSVWCWGDATGKQGVPKRVDGLDHVVEIAVGMLWRCALRSDGAVSCFDWNQLCLDPRGVAGHLPPMQVLGPGGALAVAAGSGFACALAPSGKVLCWGGNEHGALGDGTRSYRCSASPVTGIEDAVEIAAGSEHACARRKEGSIVCWGADAAGQLGRAAPGTCPFLGQVFDAPPPKPVPCALVPLQAE